MTQAIPTETTPTLFAQTVNRVSGYGGREVLAEELGISRPSDEPSMTRNIPESSQWHPAGAFCSAAWHELVLLASRRRGYASVVRCWRSTRRGGTDAPPGSQPPPAQGTKADGGNGVGP